jgi:predicted phage-related endonuclease
MRFENFIEIVKMNSNLHSKIDDVLDLEKILYSNLDLTKDNEKEKESEETSPFQIQIENEVFEFISCKNYKYHSVYININTLILSFSAFYDDLLNTIFKETLSFYADFYSTHKEKNDFSNYFSYIEDSLANINREEDTFSILNKKDLYKIVSIIFNELILMDNKFIFIL